MRDKQLWGKLGTPACWINLCSRLNGFVRCIFVGATSGKTMPTVEVIVVFSGARAASCALERLRSTCPLYKIWLTEKPKLEEHSYNPDQPPSCFLRLRMTPPAFLKAMNQSGRKTSYFAEFTSVGKATEALQDLRTLTNLYVDYAESLVPNFVATTPVPVDDKTAEIPAPSSASKVEATTLQKEGSILATKEVSNPSPTPTPSFPENGSNQGDRSSFTSVASINESTVEQLVAMGYEEELVHLALSKSNGHVENALDWIEKNPGYLLDKEAVENGSLQQELEKASMGAAPASSMGQSSLVAETTPFQQTVAPSTSLSQTPSLAAEKPAVSDVTLTGMREYSGILYFNAPKGFNLLELLLNTPGFLKLLIRKTPARLVSAASNFVVEAYFASADDAKKAYDLHRKYFGATVVTSLISRQNLGNAARLSVEDIQDPSNFIKLQHIEGNGKLSMNVVPLDQLEFWMKSYEGIKTFVLTDLVFFRFPRIELAEEALKSLTLTTNLEFRFATLAERDAMKLHLEKEMSPTLTVPASQQHTTPVTSNPKCESREHSNHPAQSLMSVVSAPALLQESSTPSFSVKVPETQAAPAPAHPPSLPKVVEPSASTSKPVKLRPSTPIKVEEREDSLPARFDAWERSPQQAKQDLKEPVPRIDGAKANTKYTPSVVKQSRVASAESRTPANSQTHESVQHANPHSSGYTPVVLKIPATNAVAESKSAAKATPETYSGGIASPGPRRSSVPTQVLVVRRANKEGKVILGHSQVMHAVPELHGFMAAAKTVKSSFIMFTSIETASASREALALKVGVPVDFCAHQYFAQALKIEPALSSSIVRKEVQKAASATELNARIAPEPVSLIDDTTECSSAPSPDARSVQRASEVILIRYTTKENPKVRIREGVPDAAKLCWGYVNHFETKKTCFVQFDSKEAAKDARVRLTLTLGLTVDFVSSHSMVNSMKMAGAGGTAANDSDGVGPSVQQKIVQASYAIPDHPLNQKVSNRSSEPALRSRFNGPGRGGNRPESWTPRLPTGTPYDLDENDEGHRPAGPRNKPTNSFAKGGVLEGGPSGVIQHEVHYTDLNRKTNSSRGRGSGRGTYDRNHVSGNAFVPRGYFNGGAYHKVSKESYSNYSNTYQQHNETHGRFNNPPAPLATQQQSSSLTQNTYSYQEILPKSSGTRAPVMIPAIELPDDEWCSNAVPWQDQASQGKAELGDNGWGATDNVPQPSTSNQQPRHSAPFQSNQLPLKLAQQPYQGRDRATFRGRGGSRGRGRPSMAPTVALHSRGIEEVKMAINEYGGGFSRN
ncbi:hypothetical protein BC830DRAFT_305647 [Chytriomyces sp. MP71]|nr:hypothetical protein BC830DRAFT_305647 [Chytriomyces sp. MP71]